MRPMLLCAALAASAVSIPLHASQVPTPAEVARQAGQVLVRHYDDEGPGAALLIARGDTVLFRDAIGEADAAADVPLEADDLFRIGSVTKQFTAAGVLKLAEAGKLSLDDPLSRFLPDFPNGDNVTVRQLLNHTSGIKSYTAIPELLERAGEDVTTGELIAGFRDAPVDFAPGTDFLYSNSGYVLLGAIIEKVSGQAWHEYLEQALFEPLGMKDTGYGDDPAIAARQVQGYEFKDGEFVPDDLLDMSFAHAAGALVSTLDDLHTWNRALHEGRVLSKDAYRQMITPTGEAAEDGVRYGFGIAHTTLRGRQHLGHGGGINGFLSYLMYLPESDLSIAVLQNSGDTTQSVEPAALARRLAAFAIGDPYPAVEPVPVEPAVLKSYEGVYRVNDTDTRVLRVVDGQLTAQRTGGARDALTPIARDVFVYPDGFNRFRIERDEAGGISGMRFFANGEGDGEFAPLTDAPLPVEVDVALTPEQMQRVTGTYVSGPMTLKVFIEGEALKAQLVGQPAFTLAAASPSEFSVAEVGAKLKFAPAQGPAQMLTLYQGGAELKFERSE